MFFFDLSPISRSPGLSYQEEDSGVREAEVKLEQIQLDQESPEETMAVREEERLCQEEEEVEEQEKQEQVEQEVGSGGADPLLSRALVGGLMLGAALPCLGSPLLLVISVSTDVLSWHNLGLVPLSCVLCLLMATAGTALLWGGVFAPRACGGFAMSLSY